MHTMQVNCRKFNEYSELLMSLNLLHVYVHVCMHYVLCVHG